jgi:hypothetical protein
MLMDEPGDGDAQQRCCGSKTASPLMPLRSAHVGTVIPSPSR